MAKSPWLKRDKASINYHPLLFILLGVAIALILSHFISVDVTIKGNNHGTTSILK